MARKKTILVEEETSSLVDEKLPDEQENIEMENVSVEGTNDGDLNLADGTNGDLVENEEKEEKEEKEDRGEEEEKEKRDEKRDVNFNDGIGSRVVTDPIMGARVVYQPQASSNNYSGVEGVRGENGRRGEIIKR